MKIWLRCVHCRGCRLLMLGLGTITKTLETILDVDDVILVLHGLVS